MLNIAHRGANREANENTLEAIELAVSIGCERIEIDVQVTKDKVPVVIHDSKLYRLFGKRKKLQDLTWKQLRELPLSRGGQVPSLEMVLDKYLDRVSLNLEFKTRRGSDTKAVLETIGNLSSHENLIVSSFNLETLVQTRAEIPRLAVAMLWERSSRLYLRKSLKKCMDILGTNIAHPEMSLINPAIMQLARQHDWKVFTWAPMKSEAKKSRIKEWEKLWFMGVDGHCTNEPREFKTFLDQKSNN